MRRIIKIRRLKQPWSHCHVCGKGRRDKGHEDAPNELLLNLPHGHRFNQIWLCDNCLGKLKEEILEEVSSGREG